MLEAFAYAFLYAFGGTIGVICTVVLVFALLLVLSGH